MNKPAVTFVIMAGGKGERLWPLVRRNCPKVCLKPDGRRSLLEATIARLRAAWPAADWLIVTTAGQAGPIRRVLPKAWHRAILVEPAIRNTAACITLAAIAVAQRDPQRLLVVAPADHWIDKPAAFQRAIRTAIHAAARHETLATIGLRPTAPHTGLGYLCAGTPVRPGVFRLARFVEKPSLAQAKQLLKRPRTFWNGGYFIGSAETFLTRITEWLPDHTRRLAPLAATRRSLAALARRAAPAYRRLKAVSFDHGVMEHAREGLIVEGGFRWADLGAWDTWAALSRAPARVLSVESSGVTVVGTRDHVVATLGVRDLIIVHTPTATLVCDRRRVQAVRDLAKRLERDRRWAAFC